MKIIQIRGNNGVGKTTMVREFINANGSNCEITSVSVGPRKIECHKINDIIIIGRYDKAACGGCDAAIKTGEELKNTIAKIVRTLKPSIIIFEGVMYGKSYGFTYEIYKYAQAIKADFVAICLEPSFDVSLERIYSRNGGKEVNVKSLESGWRGSIKSNKKLEFANVPIISCDTGKLTKEEMGKLLEDTVNER